MKTTRNRPSKTESKWPRTVRLGRTVVRVYRRPGGKGEGFRFLVANYADGKRRFETFGGEEEALAAATRLARQLSEKDVLSATMTKGDALQYASAVQTLQPHGVTLPAVASTVAECLKVVPTLADIHAAVRFFAARHRRVTDKRVADVVVEILEVKTARGASTRYLSDLRSRLGQFAAAFQCNASSVTTAHVQEWLDGLKLGSQSYANMRRVLHLLFGFAVARGYAVDNPIEGVERVKVRNGAVGIFTPGEIAKLLAAASPEFLPSLAIGAFGGLRSAEIERLRWEDVDLAGGWITVGADRAKTASRRVVPIVPNLSAWLAPHAGRKGNVWTGGHDEYYEVQQATAERAGVKWKANALRHSFASYRFAEIGDAGRVAGELGNSAAVVHRHYRELVKAGAARAWFSVVPSTPANVTALNAAASA